jgi:hypothetical protein
MKNLFPEWWRIPVISLLFFLTLFPLPAQVAAASPALGGCPVLPANNIWNTPIDSLPVSSSSSAFIASIGADAVLHPDFGAGLWNGGPIGIPINIVSGTQPKLPISFSYADESDPGPYPIPPNPLIEGGMNSSGDRHLLVLDSDACRLYEAYSAYPQVDGSWHAGSGAVYDLGSNFLRPLWWTSADAAGTPMLPGLVRYDELAAGDIRHAVEFTAPHTFQGFVWPARHFASSLTDPIYPPMGQRFRLKADLDISGFSPQVQVLLRALKKYGMILVDNGSPWFISGMPDERWNNDVFVNELRRVKGSDFEAVDGASLLVNGESGMALAAINTDPPGAPVRLIFIHHSTGENWLNDDNGGLGMLLRDNNYFVSDTNYGWGPDPPDPIGNHTDIGDWWSWFRGANAAQYMAALFAESGQHSSYSRIAATPAGENELVMFKSCFPNSALQGNPGDPVPSIGSNLLKGQGSGSVYHTVANAKGIYLDLLEYFRTRQDKLFVVITAPPLSDPTYADNARAFNQWLVNEWLNNYPYRNVAVFDFYNVLTTNGGTPDINDLGLDSGNHHRWRQGGIQHITNGDNDSNPNILEYPSTDDHPSRAGNLKATGEFVTLLNIFYHNWKSDVAPMPTLTLNPVATPTGLTHQVIGGTTDAGGTITVSLNGGAAHPATVIGANWSYAITGLASGANNITITAENRSWNRTIVYSSITCNAPKLTVAVNGTGDGAIKGGGTVTSDPAGISCLTGSCASLFDKGIIVKLMASPDSNSLFTGWAGACANTSGNCTPTMDADKSATAAFSFVQPARTPGPPASFFPAIGAACAALTGGGTVQAREYEFRENLLLNSGFPLILNGGYDIAYSANPYYSTLKGTLTVQSGSLTLDRLIIK